MKIWSPDLFGKAWDFATTAHEGQTYGGKTEGSQISYLNHIGSVAAEVIWCLQNSDSEYDANLAIQCAILHDTLEDTTHTYQEIIYLFGKDVAEGVLALTKDNALPVKDRMADSLYRIKLQPHEIWIVKMADRITNLYHPPYYWKNDRIAFYEVEALLIYKELKAASRVISDRLLDKIENYRYFIK